MSSAHDTLRIDGLDVECIIGVYPHERDTPQPLRVSLAMQLDTRAAARQGALKKSVDYARLCGELRFLLEACRFLLLETAADALCHYLLAPPASERAVPDRVSVRLEKPRALDGPVPSLEVVRGPDDVRYRTEQKPFGQVDVIYESRECGIYQLRVAPGAHIETHRHFQMDESELMLGDGLHLQGAPVAAGDAVRWPRGFAHRYDNPTNVEQTILCVDRPPFIPADEEPTAAALLPVPADARSRYYPDPSRPSARASRS